MKSILCVDTPNLYTDGDILHTTGYSANISLSIREMGLRAGDIISATCQNITYNGTQSTRGLLYMYPQELSTNLSCPPCLKISLLQGKNGIRRQDVLTDDPYFGFIYFGTDNTDGNVTGLEIYKLNKNIGETLYLGSSDLDNPKNPIETSNIVTCEGTIEGKSLTLPVASKNLFTTAYKSYSQYGVYTADGTNGFTLASSASNTVPEVEFTFTPKVGRYTISFNATCVNSPDTSFRPNELLTFEDGKVTGVYKMGGDQTAQSHSYTFTKKMDGSSLRLAFYASVVSTSFSNYSMKIENIQFEIGEVATEYTPYVTDGTSVNVTACGKNLLSYPYNYGDDFTQNGVTFTVNSDTSITVSGTPTAYAGYVLSNMSPLIFDEMTFGVLGESENIVVQVGLYNSDKEFIDNVNNPLTKIYTFVRANFPSAVYYTFSIKRLTDNIAVSGTLYPMVVKGSALPSYEPYKEQTYSTEVGESVEILQYDKITNVFTDNAGVTVFARTYPNLEIRSVRSLLKAGSNVIGSQAMSEQ